MTTIKIDSETVEVDGEVYKREKKESVWPFVPLLLQTYPCCDLTTSNWMGTGGTTDAYLLFPTRDDCDKAASHLRRVLKSMRLYENAKAEGKLWELWLVAFITDDRPARPTVESAGDHATLYTFACAQAGRLFATLAEAEEYAKTL